MEWHVTRTGIESNIAVTLELLYGTCRGRVLKHWKVEDRREEVRDYCRESSIDWRKGWYGMGVAHLKDGGVVPEVASLGSRPHSQIYDRVNDGYRGSFLCNLA